MTSSSDLSVRRVLQIGVAWAVTWSIAAILLMVVVGFVDPDSIDPGEGPLRAVMIFGPMGAISGIAFALLWSRAGRSDSIVHAILRAAAVGFASSFIGQLAFLGHGDQGLVANIQLALVFSAFGSLVAIGWFLASRMWSHRQRPVSGGAA